MLSQEGEISKHFGESPYFALVQVNSKTNHVKNKEIITNPYTQKEKGKGIAVAEDLVHRGIDYLVVKESLRGKGPHYVLEDYLVKLVNTDKNRMEEVFRDLGIIE
ncbi:MAG: hypothetical protein GF421_08360 [Candidatus Aminicenantes bacterium]|nr:hypothetical protein [Candidatus Aminicenantes bacterium]